MAGEGLGFLHSLGFNNKRMVNMINALSRKYKRMDLPGVLFAFETIIL